MEAFRDKVVSRLFPRVLASSPAASFTFSLFIASLFAAYLGVISVKVFSEAFLHARSFEQSVCVSPLGESVSVCELRGNLFEFLQISAAILVVVFSLFGGLYRGITSSSDFSRFWVLPVGLAPFAIGIGSSVNPTSVFISIGGLLVLVLHVLLCMWIHHRRQVILSSAYSALALKTSSPITWSLFLAYPPVRKLLVNGDFPLGGWYQHRSLRKNFTLDDFVSWCDFDDVTKVQFVADFLNMAETYLNPQGDFNPPEDLGYDPEFPDYISPQCGKCGLCPLGAEIIDEDPSTMCSCCTPPMRADNHYALDFGCGEKVYVYDSPLRHEFYKLHRREVPLRRRLEKLVLDAAYDANEVVSTTADGVWSSFQKLTDSVKRTADYYLGKVEYKQRFRRADRSTQQWVEQTAYIRDHLDGPRPRVRPGTVSDECPPYDAPSMEPVPAPDRPPLHLREQFTKPGECDESSEFALDSISAKSDAEPDRDNSTTEPDITGGTELSWDPSEEEGVRSIRPESGRADRSRIAGDPLPSEIQAPTSDLEHQIGQATLTAAATHAADNLESSLVKRVASGASNLFAVVGLCMSTAAGSIAAYTGSLSSFNWAPYLTSVGVPVAVTAATMIFTGIALYWKRRSIAVAAASAATSTLFHRVGVIRDCIIGYYRWMITSPRVHNTAGFIAGAGAYYGLKSQGKLQRIESASLPTLLSGIGLIGITFLRLPLPTVIELDGVHGIRTATWELYHFDGRQWKLGGNGSENSASIGRVLAGSPNTSIRDQQFVSQVKRASYYKSLCDTVGYEIAKPFDVSNITLVATNLSASGGFNPVNCGIIGFFCALLWDKYFGAPNDAIVEERGKAAQTRKDIAKRNIRKLWDKWYDADSESYLQYRRQMDDGEYGAAYNVLHHSDFYRANANLADRLHITEFEYLENDNYEAADWEDQSMSSFWNLRPESFSNKARTVCCNGTSCSYTKPVDDDHICVHFTPSNTVLFLSRLYTWFVDNGRPEIKIVGLTSEEESRLRAFLNITPIKVNNAKVAKADTVKPEKSTTGFVLETVGGALMRSAIFSFERAYPASARILALLGMGFGTIKLIQETEEDIPRWGKEAYEKADRAEQKRAQGLPAARDESKSSSASDAGSDKTAKTNDSFRTAKSKGVKPAAAPVKPSASSATGPVVVAAESATSFAPIQVESFTPVQVRFNGDYSHMLFAKLSAPALGVDAAIYGVLSSHLLYGDKETAQKGDKKEVTIDAGKGAVKETLTVVYTQPWTDQPSYASSLTFVTVPGGHSKYGRKFFKVGAFKPDITVNILKGDGSSASSTCVSRGNLLHHPFSTEPGDCGAALYQFQSNPGSGQVEPILVASHVGAHVHAKDNYTNVARLLGHVGLARSADLNVKDIKFHAMTAVSKAGRGVYSDHMGNPCDAFSLYVHPDVRSYDSTVKDAVYDYDQNIFDFCQAHDSLYARGLQQSVAFVDGEIVGEDGLRAEALNRGTAAFARKPMVFPQNFLARREVYHALISTFFRRVQPGRSVHVRHRQHVEALLKLVSGPFDVSPLSVDEERYAFYDSDKPLKSGGFICPRKFDCPPAYRDPSSNVFNDPSNAHLDVAKLKYELVKDSNSVEHHGQKRRVFFVEGAGDSAIGELLFRRLIERVLTADLTFPIQNRFTLFANQPANLIEHVCIALNITRDQLFMLAIDIEKSERSDFSATYDALEGYMKQRNPSHARWYARYITLLRRRNVVSPTGDIYVPADNCISFNASGNYLTSLVTSLHWAAALRASGLLHDGVFYVNGDDIMMFSSAPVDRERIATYFREVYHTKITYDSDWGTDPSLFQFNGVTLNDKWEPYMIDKVFSSRLLYTKDYFNTQSLEGRLLSFWLLSFYNDDRRRFLEDYAQYRGLQIGTDEHRVMAYKCYNFEEPKFDDEDFVIVPQSGRVGPIGTDVERMPPKKSASASPKSAKSGRGKGKGSSSASSAPRTMVSKKTMKKAARSPAMSGVPRNLVPLAYALTCPDKVAPGTAINARLASSGTEPTCVTGVGISSNISLSTSVHPYNPADTGSQYTAGVANARAFIFYPCSSARTNVNTSAGAGPVALSTDAPTTVYSAPVWVGGPLSGPLNGNLLIPNPLSATGVTDGSGLQLSGLWTPHNINRQATIAQEVLDVSSAMRPVGGFVNFQYPSTAFDNVQVDAYTFSTGPSGPFSTAQTDDWNEAFTNIAQGANQLEGLCPVNVAIGTNPATSRSLATCAVRAKTFTGTPDEKGFCVRLSGPTDVRPLSAPPTLSLINCGPADIASASAQLAARRANEKSTAQIERLRTELRALGLRVPHEDEEEAIQADGAEPPAQTYVLPNMEYAVVGPENDTFTLVIVRFSYANGSQPAAAQNAVLASNCVIEFRGTDNFRTASAFPPAIESVREIYQKSHSLDFVTGPHSFWDWIKGAASTVWNGVKDAAKWAFDNRDKIATTAETVAALI